MGGGGFCDILYIMQIINLVVGQVRTNCYLVVDDEGGPACRQAGIIDPGDDGDYIIRKIEDIKLKPVWVLATHGHFDHLLAVTEVVLTYNIPFYLHPEDKFFLPKAQKSVKHFFGIDMDPILIEPIPISSKTNLKVGKTIFQIIETPGHSPGGICLYSKKEKVLFSGDLIFGRGLVGRTDFKYCSKEDLKKSIKKILKLPEDVMVYPGHGEESTLGKTKSEYLLATKKLARSEFS